MFNPSRKGRKERRKKVYNGHITDPNISTNGTRTVWIRSQSSSLWSIMFCLFFPVFGSSSFMIYFNDANPKTPHIIYSYKENGRKSYEYLEVSCCLGVYLWILCIDTLQTNLNNVSSHTVTVVGQLLSWHFIALISASISRAVKNIIPFTRYNLLYKRFD